MFVYVSHTTGRAVPRSYCRSQYANGRTMNRCFKRPFPTVSELPEPRLTAAAVAATLEEADGLVECLPERLAL